MMREYHNYFVLSLSKDWYINNLSFDPATGGAQDKLVPVWRRGLIVGVGFIRPAPPPQADEVSHQAFTPMDPDVHREGKPGSINLFLTGSGIEPLQLCINDG